MEIYDGFCNGGTKLHLIFLFLIRYLKPIKFKKKYFFENLQEKFAKIIDEEPREPKNIQ
jgi:hypothetical protein